MAGLDLGAGQQAANAMLEGIKPANLLSPYETFA